MEITKKETRSGIEGSCYEVGLGFPEVNFLPGLEARCD